MVKHKLRTPVSFDKISVTLQIDDEYKLKLKDQLLLLLETYKEKGRIAKHYSHQERYGNIFRFEVPTDTDEGHFVLKILIYPMDKAHNFFKVEFNPNKLGTKGGPKLCRILNKVLGAGGANRLYAEGRITRIDLAIDVYKPVNCFMLMKGAVKSEIILGESGKIESQIVGSETSKSHVTLYDKAVEQAGSDDKPERAWYRLEIVMRNLGFSMSEIPQKLQNYFKKISFYRVTLLADGYFDGDFLAQVQADGLNAALHAQGRNVRTRYLRRLSVHQYEPFNLRRLSIKQAVETMSFLDVNRVDVV